MIEVTDAWMQLPTARFLREPCFASLNRWNRQTHSDDVDYDGLAEAGRAMGLQSMTSSGVTKGLVSAWSNPSGYLISNDEVASFIDGHQGLYGVAAVNLRKPEEAVPELRRAVNELGFKALRVVQWMWELPPTSPYYYPLYLACVELNIPVCLQVGHTGPLMTSETGRPIPYIDRIALDFPSLRIVGGHVGYPWTNEMIAVATKHENVFIDTSAYSAARYPQELVGFIQTNGSKKVMFGTNFPMIPHGKCLKGIDALIPDEAKRRSFLHENADRVFNLPPSSATATDPATVTSRL
eukprot:GFYU01008630.1.p1 GENE.GFYU01008630.1~~GFYU01008630.1.p1  ORF type:complete len:314 (-),score=38.71 GFYU01008630.1:298-1182(-)